MSISLQKGQKVSLSKDNSGLSKIIVGLGWDEVKQSKMTAALASGSSIKIETLETTWRTIMNGIDETKQIQDNARRQRVEDKARLDNIKQEFNKMYKMSENN